MSGFTLSCRESGEEGTTDLEMLSATEKYTIGTVDSEYAPRIVACVNACRDLPDDILRKINNGQAKIALLAHPDPFAPEIINEPT